MSSIGSLARRAHTPRLTLCPAASVKTEERSGRSGSERRIRDGRQGGRPLGRQVRPNTGHRRQPVEWSGRGRTAPLFKPGPAGVSWKERVKRTGRARSKKPRPARADHLHRGRCGVPPLEWGAPETSAPARGKAFPRQWNKPRTYDKLKIGLQNPPRKAFRGRMTA